MGQTARTNLRRRKIMKRMALITLLIASPVWAGGELQIGGLLGHGPEQFSTGVGWEVNWQQEIGESPWLWTAGVSGMNWGFERQEWQYGGKCWSIDGNVGGSVTDLRPAVGLGVRHDLPFGCTGAALVDIGYDILDSDVSETSTWQHCKCVRRYQFNYELDDTWSSQIRYEVTKPLTGHLALVGSVGYMHCWDDQEFTWMGHGTGQPFDPSGWRIGTSLKLRF
jgi:hypothetical protein